MLTGDYEPSAWGPVADHVDAYEAGTNYLMEGAPCVVLWTVGAKTGKIRKSPLMRVEHEGRYAVVASMGGMPKHPVWYHNVVANPDVTLQDRTERRDYVAREVEGDEKAEWWARAVEVWPSYDDYQASTDRQIPVFVLDPAE